MSFDEFIKNYAEYDKLIKNFGDRYMTARQEYYKDTRYTYTCIDYELDEDTIGLSFSEHGPYASPDDIFIDNIPVDWMLLNYEDLKEKIFSECEETKIRKQKADAQRKREEKTRREKQEYELYLKLKEKYEPKL